MVVTVAHAGRSVLVDVGGGRRITLDAFGARVWALLDQRPTLPRLLAGLSDEPGTADDLSTEVTRLLASWRALGVIDWR